jgi:hypothetical protein
VRAGPIGIRSARARPGRPPPRVARAPRRAGESRDARDATRRSATQQQQRRSSSSSDAAAATQPPSCSNVARQRWTYNERSPFTRSSA